MRQCICNHSDKLHNTDGCRLPNCDCKGFIIYDYDEAPLWNYTDAEIDQCDQAAFDKAVKEQASVLIPGYNADDYDWEEPETKPCECVEWARYGYGERHRGYYWHYTCSMYGCNCECHNNIWLMGQMADVPMAAQ